MKLKDLLGIKPGTLVKGLVVEASGVIRLNTEGWDIRHDKNPKKLLSEDGQETYKFTFYKDERVSELISKGKIQIFKPDNITWSLLRSNGSNYFKDIKYYFEEDRVAPGECLGMSLGKTFIAMQPSHADIYRPDFYEIYAFHNILQGKKSRWIVLQSKTQYKGLLMIEPDRVLLNIKMELL